jgi:protein-tyrosine phosphatase
VIDLHSHVLPGVDDGADTLDEAVAICRQAAREGTTVIVATPHLRHESFWNDDRDLLVERFRLLKAAVGDEIEVLLGGEIAINSESVEELGQLPGGGLLTLAGSRYVLLELDFRGYGPDPVEVIYETEIAGYIPILAHPERLPWLMADFGLMAALVENGALCQLTAMSLTGELGPGLRERSLRLIEKGWVQFVASDTHDLIARRPGLAKVRATLTKDFDERTANELLLLNPRLVIENKLRQIPAAASGSQSSSVLPFRKGGLPPEIG